MRVPCRVLTRASFRWRAPCLQQVLSLPGTRPQQEQIPPQRKRSGRLDVNNSRGGGGTRGGGSSAGAEAPSGGGGRGKGEASGKGTSKVGTLRAPEDLSVLISHTP